MKREWAKRLGVALLSVALLGVVSVCAGTMAVAQGSSGQKATTVLGAAQLQKMLPSAVYFKGQSATTQLRNSGGLKFGDGSYLLAVLVDTSGYSSEVAQRYQAYLITEDAVKVGGERLAAGVYGVGFVGGDKFVVMDVGAHDLMTVSSATDETMKRPRPLMVTGADGKYRLYEGRRYVTIER